MKFKIGERVIIKNSFMYSGVYDHHTGTIMAIGPHEVDGSFAVKLDGKINPSNHSGNFIFYERELESYEGEYTKMNNITVRDRTALIRMLISWAKSRKIEMDCLLTTIKVTSIVITNQEGYRWIIEWDNIENVYDAFTAITNDIVHKLHLSKYEFIYDTESLKRQHPAIKNVIFNNPATIVMWSDGTKTVVKCGEDDTYDPEKGLAMAISKKFLGANASKSNYLEEFKKWLPKEEKEKCVPKTEVGETN